jgi:rhomboid protease GluP
MAPRPVVSRALTAAIVATSLLAFVSPAVLDALMKDDARILAGEWWRLVTVALVHGSLMHLAFNAFALWDLGALAETLFGRTRFLAVFVVGTAVATVASVVWNPSPAVGASGGVFAVVGALLVLALRSRGTLAEPFRRRLVRDMVVIVGVNLVFGFTVTYVDNAAHLGGLVAGALLGAAAGFGPEMRRAIEARRRMGGP